MGQNDDVEESLMRRSVASTIVTDSTEMKAEIADRAHELTREIMAFCRSQRNLWQKIPYLAFEADGRSGLNNKYRRAYEVGYWQLQGSLVPAYGYTVFVDLATGELVDSVNHDQPARSDMILRLASNIDELDAELLLRDLEEEAGRSATGDQNSQANRRRQFGLERIYKRGK